MSLPHYIQLHLCLWQQSDGVHILFWHAKKERAIFENLAQLSENRTVIIVAHRLSTIKKADQIIVLDDGVIVEVGNHDELISKQGNYYELVKNQIN